MFGFMSPFFPKLGFDERRLLQIYQCGLCKALSMEYGLWTRIFVSYEGILLYLLADAQRQEIPITYLQRCPLKPMKKVETAWSTQAARFAAAISLLSITTKLEDDVHDERALPSKIISLLLRRKVAIAERSLENLGFRPRIFNQMLLSQFELEHGLQAGSLENFAHPTALLLAKIFAFTCYLSSDTKNEAVLSNLGYRVGRVIYLLDSLADFRGDMRNNCFNALTACSSQLIVERDIEKAALSETSAHEELSSILGLDLRVIKEGLESLTVYRGRGLINNMLLVNLEKRWEYAGNGVCENVKNAWFWNTQPAWRLGFRVPFYALTSNCGEADKPETDCCGNPTEVPDTDCCGNTKTDCCGNTIYREKGICD